MNSCMACYQVFNKDLSEVHILELPIEQSKVSCIAYNDRTHQLVTGGLGGIKVIIQVTVVTMVMVYCRYLIIVSNK